ncbi:CarD family transcriptional regulator [Methylosinus sporium]|uniref:CarD family transcriptional regulator n=1 Tax=Methylosinus sporium TaxID=428 RepID=UPI002692F237
MPSSSKKTAKNRKASVAGARRGAEGKTARTAAASETRTQRSASATAAGKTSKTTASTKTTSGKTASGKTASGKSVSAKTAAAKTAKTSARTAAAAGKTAAKPARTSVGAGAAPSAGRKSSGGRSAASAERGSARTQKTASSRTRAAAKTAAKASAARSGAAKSIAARSAKTAAEVTQNSAKTAASAKTTIAKAAIAKIAVAKAAVAEAPARARASATRSSEAKRSGEVACATERRIEIEATQKTAPSVEATRVETIRPQTSSEAPQTHQTSIAVAAGVTGETRITTPLRQSATNIDIEHSDVVSPSAAPDAGASGGNATAAVSTPASSETIPVPKQTQGKAVNAKSSPAPRAPAAPTSAAASSALSPKAIVAARAAAAAPIKPPTPAAKAKTSAQKLGFKTNEFIVYPAHGVGQIIAIETQEVAGFSLELFVVSFIKDKMTLKVPTSKVAAVGMRKLAENEVVDKALSTLSGRARVKRTMWSRRAQEYEAKINSGDLVTIAEVVRDLYRSDTQPEQSYSERQLYEAALDRMAREVAAVRKLIDSESLKLIESFLQKGPRRGGPKGGDDADASDDAGEEGEEDDVEERAA